METVVAIILIGGLLGLILLGLLNRALAGDKSRTHLARPGHAHSAGGGVPLFFGTGTAGGDDHPRDPGGCDSTSCDNASCDGGGCDGGGGDGGGGGGGGD